MDGIKCNPPKLEQKSKFDFNFNKEGTGHCNGHCSLCGSIGVRINTCPLNIYALSPKPKKHTYAGKKNGRLLNGDNFLVRMLEPDEEEERYHDFPGSQEVEEFFENNYETCSLASMHCDIRSEHTRDHHIAIGFYTNIYNDDYNTSIIINVALSTLQSATIPGDLLVELLEDIVDCFETDPTSDFSRKGFQIRYAKTNLPEK